MKKILSFILAVLMITTACSSFTVLNVSAEDDQPVTLLSYNSLEKAFNRSKNSVTDVYISSKGTSLPYRLYVPGNYDPDKSYPLVLFFHGAGESGNDNNHIFRGGSILQRLLTPTDHKNHPCLILAPQCGDTNNKWVSSDWTPGTYDHTKIQKSPYMTAAEELLEKVLDEYSVDENALYVSGMSMGGFGTWDIISRNPDKFAAAIPVCGGTDESYLEGLRGMPIRTFHAAGDPIVNCAGTRKANEILSGYGDFLYTEFPDDAHNVWDRAYATPGLTDWLFAQRKESDPVPPSESIEPSESAEPSAETAVNGYVAYVNERGVVLYFCFDEQDAGKTIEVTVDTVVKKYNVVEENGYKVGISLTTDQLESKIELEFEGNAIDEYSLKQYLNAVVQLSDATAEQKSVAEAILGKQDYVALLPEKKED